MQIKVTEQLLRLFRDNNIFFTCNGADRFKVGDTLDYLPTVKIEPYSTLLGGNSLYNIGAFSYSWSAWANTATIGRYSSISTNVCQMRVQHPTDRFTTSNVTCDLLANAKKALADAGNNYWKIIPVDNLYSNNEPIIIGNDVWIAADVTIKRGVKINDGAIVAARAVVTKDVPPFAVVGGVPAIVLKYRFPDNIIDELLELQWWNYNFAHFGNVNVNMNIRQFIDTIRNEIAKGVLHPFSPPVLTASCLSPPPEFQADSTKIGGIISDQSKIQEIGGKSNMTPDQKKCMILRGCFYAGYSFPEYCRDNGINKPLIISYDENFLWELYVQFRYSKINIAPVFNYYFNAAWVDFNVSSLIGGLSVAKYDAKGDFSKYDKIFVLSTNNFPALPQDKTMYFGEILNEFISYTYAKHPLDDFVRRNPGVTVIVSDFPVLANNERATENERNILQRNTHTVAADIKKRVDKNTQIPTMFDEFGYDNDTVLKFLDLTSAVTDEKGCTKLIDVHDDIVNVVNGKRQTAYQPKSYKNTIYCMGTCIYFGYGAPYDKTFESYLQEIANNSEKAEYLIDNSSQFYAGRYQDIFYNLNVLPVKSGDIVLICLQGLKAKGFPFFATKDMFTRPHDYGEVFTDDTHLNERGNKILAEKFWQYLSDNDFFRSTQNAANHHQAKPHVYGIPDWVATEPSNILAIGGNKLIEYKKELAEIRDKTIGKVGAVVVNCNPFTLGHRHLLEYAAKKVVHLFVFAVEEDKSFFQFADRFELIKKGVEDLRNITVLPSGQFIISALTFSGYFNKTELQYEVIDPTMDVEVFAKHIAPSLGITIRFAGEEPLDKVTLQYNQAMARILPKHGVQFEVIQRKESGGAVISASRVRALLKENNFEEIKKIVPYTTFSYLMDKYGNRGGGLA